MSSCGARGLSQSQRQNADTLGRTAWRTRTTEKKKEKMVRAMVETSEVPCAVLYCEDCAGWMQLERTDGDGLEYMLVSSSFCIKKTSHLALMCVIVAIEF